MAMKLDMVKAYVHLEWNFLLAMMEAMCFPPEFCHRIAECITIASYNVLINGASTWEGCGKEILCPYSYF